MEQVNEREAVEAQARNLLSALNDNGLKSDVERVTQVDSMADLRDSLAGFFKDRVKTVSESEAFRAELIADLRMDLSSGKLTFDQKLVLLSRISSEANEAASDLISIFRPSPGAPSIFQEMTSKQTGKNMEDAYKNYTPEQLQRIDALYRYISSVDSDKDLATLLNRTEPTTESRS